MRGTSNFIFITVEKEFEDKILGPEGKVELELISFKEDIIDRDSDEIIYNVNQKKINYGTVIGVPRHLTEDVKLYQQDEGLPGPVRYIDHDTVQKIGVDFVQYECGIWEPTWKALADVEMEVREGDRIYFHFNTLIPENKVKLPDGRQIYKLAYQNALCVVRNEKRWFNPKEFKILSEWEKTLTISEETKRLPDEKVYIDFTPIIPVAGHVFIEPKYEEGFEDLGIEGSVNGKINSFGLVTDITSKPKPLEGIVRHICTPLKGDEIDFKAGDTILYFKNADWEVKIEGKNYYCMKYWDVIAKIED